MHLSLIRARLPHRTVGRRTFGLAAAAAVTLLAVAGGPVGATTRAGFEIAENKPVSTQYPALVGANPQSEQDLTAADCKTVTMCDTIPFTVKVPAGLKEDEGFFISIEVSWADPGKSNDVDLYLFDNGQLKGGAATRMTKSTTSSNPEKVTLQQPDLGEYQLVVMNVNGLNQGYTVKAKLVKARFESPVEALAPPKSPPPAAAPAESQEKPKESIDNSPPPPSSSSSPEVTLVPVPVGTDLDFDFSTSDFQSELAAPPAAGPDGLGSLRQPPARKVGTLPLVLSFVVLPLVALGGAAAFVLRRRNSLLITA